MNGSEEVVGVTEEDDEGDVFGMMDDDEEDEVMFGMMDEDEDEETSGGSGDNLQKNVTGMKLNNPNPFYSRIEDRDPTLY